MSVDVDTYLYFRVENLGAALRTLAGYCRSPDWSSNAECRIELAGEEPIAFPLSDEPTYLSEDIKPGETVRVQRDRKDHRLSVIWLAQGTDFLRSISHEDSVRGNSVMLPYDVSFRCDTSYATLHIGTCNGAAGISLAADPNDDDEEAERQASLGLVAIFEAAGGQFGTKCINSELCDIWPPGRTGLDVETLAPLTEELWTSPDRVDWYVETVLNRMK